PGDPTVGTINTRRVGSTTQVGFEWNGVSEDFLSLFGLKIVAGRNFVPKDGGDVMIISEAAAKRLGFENPADAIGIRLELLKVEKLNEWPSAEIVGIMKDFRSVPFLAMSTFTYDNEFQSQGKMFFYKNRGFEKYC